MLIYREKREKKKTIYKKERWSSSHMKPPGYHQDQGVPAYQSVVSRQNGGGPHPALPPMPSGEHVTGERAVAHDTHAQ